MKMDEDKLFELIDEEYNTIFNKEDNDIIRKILNNFYLIFPLNYI